MVSDAAARVLLQLKTRGPMTAAELARRLDVTPVAVRQHLAALERAGEVAFEPGASSKRGRPARTWHLTETAAGRFPESYAELAVDLIESMRQAFGGDGLAQLVEARTRRQVKAYRDALPGADAPLQRRLAALARLRSSEGYMAECRKQRDGSWQLVENHCPICDAARACQGLCGAELELFRKVLGPDAEVEREEHLLEGARRCAYRVRKRGVRRQSPSTT